MRNVICVLAFTILVLWSADSVIGFIGDRLAASPTVQVPPATNPPNPGADDGISGQPFGDMPDAERINDANADRLFREREAAIQSQRDAEAFLCPQSAAFDMPYGPRPSEGPSTLRLE